MGGPGNTGPPQQENNMKLFTVTLFAAVTATAELPTGFIAALHRVETGGRSGAIRGDGGAAFGPLQIHRAYWHDAVQHDRSIGGRYEDVVNLRYAARIVDAYMRRYARTAYRRGDAATMARVHNGGPAGARKRATLVYLAKFRKAGGVR